MDFTIQYPLDRMHCESRSADIGSVCLYSTKSDLKSETYRVKSTFVLTDENGKSETTTVYSSEQVVS